MPSKSAKAAQPNTKRRSIVFVVYPDFKLLDLAGPLQVFADAADKSGKPAYSTVVTSLNGDSLSSDTPVSLTTDRMSNWTRRKIDTLIVAGGKGVFDATQDLRFKAMVKRLALKSRRIGSICNGAFVLAACGLLDDYCAVTHWQYCEELQESYPQICVHRDPIYVNDGNRWTSAGVTAGVDMAIAMVSEDLGRSASLALAQALVTYHVRPGGQSQFSEILSLQSLDKTGRFDELHQWILNNLTKDLRVEQLAEQVLMSPRNFSRRYLEHTGKTPAKAVETLRVEAARQMLAEGTLPVMTVASRCGFGDDERMRRSFVRLLNVTPQDYKLRFS